MGLHAEPEIGWCAVTPLDHRGLGRGPIETAVQLHTVQLLGVVGQHPSPRQSGRIELSFPRRVAETGRAGVETAYDAVTVRRSRITRSWSWPQAASASRPRVSRTVTFKPCASTICLKARIEARSGAWYGVSSTGLNGMRFTCASFRLSSAPSSFASRSVSLTPASITHS